MRIILLLLSLCLCTAVEAKKKTYFDEVQTSKKSLKSLENKAFLEFSGREFFESKDLRKLQYPLSNEETIFNENGIFVFSDHFFNESDFSYNNKIEMSGSINNLKINSSLANQASMDTAELFRKGMFYGFAVMLILLNLTCFFLFDEKPFLFYSLCLTGFTLLLFFGDGLTELFFADFASSIALETSLLIFAVGLHAVFASKFLTLKEFAPKLKWVSFFMIGVAVIACIFQWFTGNTVFSKIANLSVFAVAASYFFTGVSLFSRKNYAKFYVIATFIPLLFSVDFFILRPLGIEFLGTDGGHIKAAAIAEMIILTYGIMFRMQAVKEENELRQVEMRIFLKRQEVLTARKKTEKLVEDVYLENLIMHYDLDGLEIKLLQYISEGKDNTKIARKLKTSVADVEELTKDLYQKLEIGEQIQQDYRLVDQQPDYIYN